MAIASDDWNEIEASLSDKAADAAAVAALRKRFPLLSWTRCDDTDVTETPFRSYSRLDVHLVDAVDHCVRMTTELAAATGLVVAFRTAQ